MSRLIIILLVIMSLPAFGSPIDPEQIRVIDGDTVRVFEKKPDVRLVGFNAPETRRALCEAEGDLGAKATLRVRQLLRAGNLDLEFVACACAQSTEGTQRFNYGRRCGILKVGGRDVGEILIAEGLAVSFKCSATRCPRTPKPWCD